MSTHAPLFQTALRQQTPQILELTEKLVAIESGSYFKAGVDQVNALLVDELRRADFEIERTPMPQCGDQVMASRRMEGRGRVLILGHADTAWPQGAVRDWPFETKDGRASGPGVGAMKGGLAMGLFALRELLRGGFSGLESIRFLIVPDEELGSIHSRPRIEQAARESDWVLALEPARPDGSVVTARGAVGVFFLHAHGHGAHCGMNYRKGASAVRELSLKVSLLDSLSNPDQGIVVNVGVFRGGSARQVVPADARMDIDVRARTLEQAENVLAKIQAIAAETRDERVEVRLSGRMTRPPFPATHNRQLMQTATEVAQELGFALREGEPAGGDSDANFAAAMDIPTLDGLGPICHDICSREEAIDIASLADRGALFAGLIERLAQQRSQL